MIENSRFKYLQKYLNRLFFAQELYGKMKINLKKDNLINNKKNNNRKQQIIDSSV